jgi:hypothetical protein
MQLAFSMIHAYFWDPVDGLTKIEFPDSPAGNWGSEAWDINNHGIVTGMSRREGHSYFMHAFRYDSVTDTIVDLSDPEVYRHTVGYGLNDHGDIVGYGQRYDNYTFPMLWPMDGGIVPLPLNLRADLVYGYAEHINMLGDIVGHDTSVLPVRTESWITYDSVNNPPDYKLNLEWLLDHQDMVEWEITAAFEINDAGQICGIGIHNGLTRGFLMNPHPVDCETQPDINNDGIVDAADLAMLLGAWGSCGDCCPADLDQDGQIGAADLAILLGSWGV